ncbi:MAG: transcription termination/antitermination protein NusG [Thermoguttaceae bacterium]|nr:transcription termination/antitermination protein NusG [Thermoguttaceae bacterium]
MSSEPNNSIHEPDANRDRPMDAEGLPPADVRTAPTVGDTGPGEPSLSAPAVPAEIAAEPAEGPATAPSVEAATEAGGEILPAVALPREAAAAPSEPEVQTVPAAPQAAKPAESEPVAEVAKPSLPKSDRMDWYILKVQSNREESIREGLRRRIAIAGYEHYFGEIIIPTEKITEVKGGKKRTYKRKLYPGYLVVQMEINEDTWFLVRETPGIGDFTGAGGHPTPMNPREVQAILAKQEEKPDQQEKVKINFRVGDRVKIKEGTFENFEGEVSNIDETNGRVTVLINIFGRSTPVDIEYWQIEAV